MTAVSLGMPPLPSRRAPRPDVPGLLDSHGRTARDLRVSLTEKCSLRCTYCMPAEGLPAIAASRLMATHEVIRLVSVAVNHLGVTDVRFTGGEPLLRADLAAIVAGCLAEAGGASYSMTTNGVGLERRAEALAAAGLRRVNVSLDTIDRDLFAALTRRDRIDSVTAGIRAAVRHGLAPVKVNAVALPQALGGAADLLRWCVDEGVSLRFIESMPLDADRTWSKESMVTAEVLLQELGRHFSLTPRGREDASAPAELWDVDGGPANVGVIGSVTRSFCGDCDRTRLTAEGAVSSCLFDDTETDLLGALRAGADDLALAEAWRAAMWLKPAGHSMEAATFTPPTRTMGAIGG